MPTPVIMPKMEMSQESATVINWLIKEGTEVEKGAPLLEVETDKVTVEIESPAAGVLGGITVSSGDVVPVTTIIAYVLLPGEQLPDDQLVQNSSYLDSEIPGDSGPKEYAVRNTQSPSSVSPVAQRLATDLGIDLIAIRGSGPGGRITKADVLAADASRGAGSKIPASPAARRVAREQDVELAEIDGSGPRGRIQVADVELVINASIETEKDATHAVVEPESTEGIPLTGMRRTIANRMTKSWQTAPHITFSVDVDMSTALQLREALNLGSEKIGRPRISVTGLLVRTCAWALERHPLVNAALINDTIYLQPAINIGVAVALEEGLIVPVIAAANELGFQEISTRLTDMSRRARGGHLLPVDVSGGTFTISNLGMYRVDRFTAIINPPQSAILAVGRTKKRQIVIDTDLGDEVVIKPMMNLTLSADHRVLDGAQAASFLDDVVAVLEQPTLMLL